MIKNSSLFNLLIVICYSFQDINEPN